MLDSSNSSKNRSCKKTFNTVKFVTLWYPGALRDRLVHLLLNPPLASIWSINFEHTRDPFSCNRDLSFKNLNFSEWASIVMPGYRVIYNRLTKQPLSQKLITNYIVTPKMSTPIECEVASSSDERDFEQVLHKKISVLNYEAKFYM